MHHQTQDLIYTSKQKWTNLFFIFLLYLINNINLMYFLMFSILINFLFLFISFKIIILFQIASLDLGHSFLLVYGARKSDKIFLNTYSYFNLMWISQFHNDWLLDGWMLCLIFINRFLFPCIFNWTIFEKDNNICKCAAYLANIFLLVVWKWLKLKRKSWWFY